MTVIVVYNVRTVITELRIIAKDALVQMVILFMESVKLQNAQRGKSKDSVANMGFSIRNYYHSVYAALGFKGLQSIV